VPCAVADGAAADDGGELAHAMAKMSIPAAAST